MREITAYVEKASVITGFPDDAARLTIIPSGVSYENLWIAVIEDVDGWIRARYLTQKECKELGLPDRVGRR